MLGYHWPQDTGCPKDSSSLPRPAGLKAAEWPTQGRGARGTERTVGTPPGWDVRNVAPLCPGSRCKTVRPRWASTMAPQQAEQNHHATQSPRAREHTVPQRMKAGVQANTECSLQPKGRHSPDTHPLTRGQTNKTRPFHMMGWDSATSRSEAPTPAAARRTLENVTLSETPDAEATYCVYMR